jgi:L-Ala-D/L-Glu epimerase
LGGCLTDAIEYIGYLFIDAPDVNAAQAKAFVASGHTTLKMKIGRDIAIDEARLRAVRDAVGRQIIIRVDPNGAWNREEALKNLDRLYDYDLEYVEQPLPRWDIDGLAELRRRSRIPIGVDESCGTFRDAVGLIQAQACDVIVVYVSQAGGMFEAKRIADFAVERGVRCVMGSASELGIATLAQAYVCAASPGFRGAADTHIHLQEDDVLEPPLTLERARIRLPVGHGMGVRVSPQTLTRFPVPDRVHAYSLYDQLA